MSPWIVTHMVEAVKQQVELTFGTTVHKVPVTYTGSRAPALMPYIMLQYESLVLDLIIIQLLFCMDLHNLSHSWDVGRMRKCVLQLNANFNAQKQNAMHSKT